MSIKHTAFLDIEDALSGRLRGAWSRYWGPLARQIDAAVARGDFDTAHKLTDTLDAQVVFDKSRRAIETLSMSSLLLGASRVSPVKRSRMAKAPRLDVVESATRQLGIMIGRNMTEALREDAHGYLSSLELTPVSNLPVAKLDDPKAAEREFLRIRLNTRGKAYFALAASLQVSRLTAFGFLAEAVEAGVEFYKIDAVLDDRTCPVCKIMDGKVFPIEAGFKHAEMILAVDDPDTLKEVAPFYAQDKLSVAKLATMSTDELIERGLLLPAYHFLCRCILVLADAPVEAVAPTAVAVTPASQALYDQQDPEVILQRLFGLTPARPVESDLPWRSGDVPTPPRETPPLFAGEIRPTAPFPAEARTRLDTALQTASSTEFATPTMQQTRPPLWRRVVPSVFMASLLAWLGFSSTKHKEQEPEPEDEDDEDDEDDETPEDTRP